MKYLYIFKKQNGEYFLEEETLAYKHIFQGENQRESISYIGRFPSQEFLDSQHEIIEKVKEYKKQLMTETVGLSGAIERSNSSGGFTMEEADYAKKVQDFSVELDKKRMEYFVSIAKKEYMDKNLNISTPQGARDLIVNMIR